MARTKQMLENLLEKAPRFQVAQKAAKKELLFKMVV